MQEINGYKIIEKIYENEYSYIFRATRLIDNYKVILKVMKNKSSYESAVLRREYDIISKLEISGIIKAYDIVEDENNLFIVFEDFWGKPLNHRDFLSLSISNILFIGSEISKILMNIHQNKIIHRDINLSNILYNQLTNQVKIIDFGLSTWLSIESKEVSNPTLLEAKLEYISPEQTTRMNRSIDYRTDLYSFGVCLYELLTGQKPFQSNDPMELIHSHLAKIPEEPLKINPEIEKPISDIVMKLLEKNAEDRYQSAYGVSNDLLYCLKELETNGKINNFKIAQKDISGQLYIVQKLFGRENEIKQLIKAFERSVEGNTELIFVSGYSGIGKSALVNELQTLITRQRGFFISGKYDQFQRNIPLSAIIQAFIVLVRHILTESDNDLKKWKTIINNELGKNGQIIIDVIPELELITGKQEPIDETIGPVEYRNRFNMIFTKFINIFTTKDHPLIIFIDDLQWVDSASLEFIKELVNNSDTHHLLLIGAYRDNEVDSTHPLISMINEIKDTKIEQIVLKPLDNQNVNQIISESLHADKNKCKELSDLVFQKTQGNPFFVNEFIKSLYYKNYLKVNNKIGNWNWDIDKIISLDVTENVVELMESQIKELSINTQNILKLAASMGVNFDLFTLSIVYEHSLKQTIIDLWDAFKKGFVISSGDYSRLYDLACNNKTGDDYLKTIINQTYRFRHDRIQQAAYNLIDDSNKEHIHLKIGWLILNNTKEDDIDDKLFDILSHLNIGRKLIHDDQQKYKLINLNITASRKAKRATAYLASVNHLKIAMSLLPENEWENNYELTFVIKRDISEVLYLSGDFENAQNFYSEIIQNARSIDDKIEVYCLQMVDYHLQGRMKEALSIQIKSLKILGIIIPENKEDLQIMFEHELKKIKTLTGSRKIHDLLYLNKMTDKKILSIVAILTRLSSTNYVIGDWPELNFWAAAKIINLSIEYGNDELSCYGYVHYGIMIACVLNDYENSYEFGRLAIELSEISNNTAIRSQVYLMFCISFEHWRKTYKASIPYYNKGFDYSMENGDYAFASYHLIFIMYYSLLSGDNLFRLKKESSKMRKIVQKICPIERYIVQQFIDYINKLCKFPCEDTSSLMAEYTDEFFSSPLRQSWAYTPKLICHYFFDEIDTALELTKNAEFMAGARPGQPLKPEIYLFTSLIFSKSYHLANQKEKSIYINTIEKYMELMKFWSSNCEPNYLHKYYLIKAEYSRIINDDTNALIFYDQAINSSKQYGFVNFQALANELAARFWFNKGQNSFATVFFKEAINLYYNWGALAIVDHLIKTFPSLLSDINFSYTKIPKTFNHTIKSSEKISTLDLTTVLKASQALSGEIELKKLVQRLMDIVIENAGATNGFLILKKADNYYIEARGTVDKKITAFKSQLLDNNAKTILANSIIKYVSRTNESVILDNAAEDKQFADDPYIITYKPKSILCKPILFQTRELAIIYLENDLTTYAFTSEHIKILDILTSQAAISLENANLYSKLDEKITELKKTYRSLNQLKNILRSIINSMPSVIIAVDTECNVIQWNFEAEKSSGITSDKAIGQQVTDVFPDIIEKINEIRLTINDHKARKESKLSKIIENEIKIFNFFIYPLHSKEISGAVIRIDDITEQSKMEDMLTQSEKMISLGGLAAGMAHEINNPLAGIIQNIQVINNRLKKDFTKNDIIAQKCGTSMEIISSYMNERKIFKMSDNIIESVKRASDIVQNMLSFVRRSDAIISLNSISDLLDKTVRIAQIDYNLKKKYDFKGIKIIREYDPSLGNVPCDAASIQQVFYNILKNGAEAMSSLENRTKNENFFILRTKIEDNMACIEIEDNGPGIDKNIQKRIFEPFFTTKEVGSGTGLGLSISYFIVTENHKGQMEVESNNGKGCRFIIKLPLSNEI